MQVGLMAPQGWKGEYDGWDAADAWARTIELARQAEALGFESLWVFDHFHTVPRPTDEITFESFSVLRPWRWRPSASGSATWSSAPGSATRRSRPRCPRRSTSSAAAGSSSASAPAGRKRSGGPTATASRRSASGWARSATISRSSGRCSARVGRRTRASTRTSAARSTSRRASRPRIPIIVGGNGERVTAGLRRSATRDELNYVFLAPDEIAERMAAVRARCEAEGRDPATLRFSLYARDEEMRDAGPGAGRPRWRRFAEIGLDRLVCFPTRWSPTLEAQAAFAEDCRAAGLPLEPAAAAVTA